MSYELKITFETAEELAEVACALENLAAQRVQNAANRAVVVEILAGSELDQQVREAEQDAATLPETCPNKLPWHHKPGFDWGGQVAESTAQADRDADAAFGPLFIPHTPVEAYFEGSSRQECIRLAAEEEAKRVEAVITAAFERRPEAAKALFPEIPVTDQVTGAVMRDPFAEPLKLEPGMYRGDQGTPTRVYKAQAGHLLAKEIVSNGRGGWSFHYLGAAPRFVKPEDRMTLEEAQEFGKQHGVCCVCAALLTDPVSVAAGVGPVCAGRV